MQSVQKAIKKATSDASDLKPFSSKTPLYSPNAGLLIECSKIKAETTLRKYVRKEWKKQGRWGGDVKLSQQHLPGPVSIRRAARERAKRKGAEILVEPFADEPAHDSLNVSLNKQIGADKALSATLIGSPVQMYEVSAKGAVTREAKPGEERKHRAASVQGGTNFVGDTRIAFEVQQGNEEVDNHCTTSTASVDVNRADWAFGIAHSRHLPRRGMRIFGRYFNEQGYGSQVVLQTLHSRKGWPSLSPTAVVSVPPGGLLSPSSYQSQFGLSCTFRLAPKAVNALGLGQAASEPDTSSNPGQPRKADDSASILSKALGGVSHVLSGVQAGSAEGFASALQRRIMGHSSEGHSPVHGFSHVEQVDHMPGYEPAGNELQFRAIISPRDKMAALQVSLNVGGMVADTEILPALRMSTIHSDVF
ncbi:unnamed protein product [Pedinophyceae sp. YPF-701]|nr:unnamed protein product [Pedinophyceae sp. YPF-701]